MRANDPTWVADSVDVVLDGEPIRVACLVRAVAGDPRAASVHAFDDDMVQIGILKWAVSPDESGTIGHVEVVLRWRRRGLATLMLEVATETAMAMAWPLPTHSAERTSDGEGWATAVGGVLPKLDCQERVQLLADGPSS